MMKIPCVAFFLIIVSFAFAEQELPAYDKFPNAIGVFSPPGVSTFGLHYQRWFGPTGIQATVVAMKNYLNKYGDMASENSIHAEIQHRMYGERFANWLSGQFYLWAALGYHGYITRTFTYSAPGVIATSMLTPFVNAVLGGIGLGIEIILLDRLSAIVEYGNSCEVPLNFLSPSFDLVYSIGFRFRF
jgi:hypothetical protein